MKYVMTVEELVAAVHRMIDTKDLDPADPVMLVRAERDAFVPDFEWVLDVGWLKAIDVHTASPDGERQLHLIAHRF